MGIVDIVGLVVGPVDGLGDGQSELDGVDVGDCVGKAMKICVLLTLLSP